MPPRKAPAAAAAPVEGCDHISNLPDDVLQHTLSFLPSLDAVRACVLAKRWRRLWKSTTILRVVCGFWKEPGSLKEIQGFMDQLLLQRIRGGTPLDTCEFCFAENDEIDKNRITHWIRIALQCKVRVLQLCSLSDSPCITAPDHHPFFVSQYLKKLECFGLEGFPDRLLDFSYCPFLEDLEIETCDLYDALLISSQSLKRLTIKDSCFGANRRIPICAPNLVSLWIEVSEYASSRAGILPSLQRMPSLLAAYVKFRRLH